MLQPLLLLNKASVSIHIVEDRTKNNLADDEHKLIHSFSKKGKNSISTFERDLFSSKYEQAPPYISYSLGINTIEIGFSERLEFTSEGKDETIHYEGIRKKKALLYVNVTQFNNSKINIWELVLHPEESYPWNEYEIIQLIKQFAGKYEPSNCCLKFCYNKEVFENIENLLITVSNEYLSNNSVLIVQAGSVQVDTKYIDFAGNFLDNASWLKLYKALYSSQFKDYNNSLELQNLYRLKDEYRYAINLFCGIVLGLFDFSRMSYEEVVDTIIPSRPTTNSFIIVNKNNVCLFCHDNDLYEEVLSNSVNIGISPYIIIPNSVLAHNDYILIESEKEINTIAGGISLKNALLDKLVRVTESQFIPNVFQYETERQLYQAGSEYRGLFEKIEDVKKSIKILSREIDSHYSNQNRLFSFVTFLITIISLTQLYTFIKDLHENTVDKVSLSTVILIILVTLVYLLMRTMKRKQI